VLPFRRRAFDSLADNFDCPKSIATSTPISKAVSAIYSEPFVGDVNPMCPIDPLELHSARGAGQGVRDRFNGNTFEAACSVNANPPCALLF